MTNKFVFFCISLLAVLVSTHVEDMAEYLTKEILPKSEYEIVKNCTTEHHIQIDDPTIFFYDWSLSPAISTNLKCTLGCVAENLGVIKDEKINWDVMMNLPNLDKFRRPDNEQFFNKTFLLQIIEACRTKVNDGEESCALGYNLAKCLKEEYMKKYRTVIDYSDEKWSEHTSLHFCKRKLNITEGYSSIFSANKSIPMERNLKCLIRCVDEMLGVINPTTKTFDWDYAEKLIGLNPKYPRIVAKGIKALHTCKNTVEYDIDDVCEFNYLVRTCYKSEYSKNTEDNES